LIQATLERSTSSPGFAVVVTPTTTEIPKDPINGRAPVIRNRRDIIPYRLKPGSTAFFSCRARVGIELILNYQPRRIKMSNQPPSEVPNLQEILDSIKKALRDLVTLEVTTVVGDVSATPKENNIGVAVTYQNSKVIQTKIDLLQGDITSVYDKAFLTGDLAAVKALHQAREEQANEIIDKNIQALKSLYELTIKVFEKE
jgi:hypothetical protein